MLSLLLSYFVVCSLSQTYLTLNGDKITIKNVIIGDAKTRGDIEINPNSGKSFTVNSKDFGKYIKHLGNNDLEFSIKKNYGLYNLQDDIENKKVKINGKQIQPTFSYMIAAHGGEWRLRKEVEKVERRGSRDYSNGMQPRIIHDTEWIVAPESDQKEEWGKDDKTVKSSKSTIYFFSKQWKSLDSHIGEQYTVLFDAGNFEDLKEKAQELGEVVKPGDKIGKGYWAAYGPEFELNSGVYRSRRNKDKWEYELVGPLGKNTKSNNVRLFDIIETLEKEFGPGDFYWNACRDPVNPKKLFTNFYHDIFKRRNHEETLKWRREKLNAMKERFKTEWAKYKKEDKQEFCKLEKEYDFAGWEEVDKDGLIKQMIKENKDLVEKTYSNEPDGEQLIHLYNGEKEIQKLKDKQQKIKVHRYKIYQEVRVRDDKLDGMGVNKHEKEKESMKTNDQCYDSWFDKYKNSNSNFDVVAENEENKKKETKEVESVMFYDYGLMDVVTIGIIIDIVLILIYCVCFGCIIAGLIGFVTGYFVKNYIDNKPQQIGKDIMEYNV